MKHVAQFDKCDDYMRLCVHFSDTLRETLEKFRSHRSMRILAVVDDDDKPIGVIREIDIRDLLFNPFGHALMTNPGFGKDINGLIKPCAVAEQHLDSQQMMAIYARQNDSPGLVLTVQGKFVESLSSDRLLEMMAEGRVARADQITQCSQQFTGRILTLSEQLSDTAHQVYALAESLGSQAAGVADAAQNVAAGAAQSSMGLQDINERGRRLANSLERLSVVASEAKAVRSQTKDVVDAAEPQMKELAVSGEEIGNIIDVIHDVGRKTNFLALNAQIEAVREDSDSLGFVAVAHEIKQLASQTRGSAEEVSKKVSKIGKAVANVLAGHREIVDAMEQISHISGQIDSAVDEQSATSLVIAGYVEQAADATADISSRAQDIGTRAHRVQANAKELERVSAVLLASASDISESSRTFVQSIQFA